MAGKSFLFQELWIEEFGLITRSAVAEDGDNRFSGPNSLARRIAPATLIPESTNRALNS